MIVFIFLSLCWICCNTASVLCLEFWLRVMWNPSSLTTRDQICSPPSGLEDDFFFAFQRERLPTPVFWPGECHALYSPWGCKESGMTDQLSLSRTNTGTHKLTVLYVVCQVHITWTWITWQFDYCKGVKYLATQKQVKFCKWKLELIHKYTDFHTEVWKKLGLRLSCSGHTGSFVSDQWSFP